MKQNRMEEIKSALQTARNRYNARLAEIRSDSHFSDYGKADLIANAYDEYTRQRETLKSELEEVKANERARLERLAFNAPMGKQTEYRDAIARASALTERGDRERAFEMALKTGDTLMLRAMAAVGHGLDADEHHWQTVIKASEHDKDIRSLVEFEAEHGSLRSAGQKFHQSAELSAPMKPAEASLANRTGARDAAR